LPIAKPLVVTRSESCCAALLWEEPTEDKSLAEMEVVDAVFRPSKIRLPVIVWSPLGRSMEPSPLLGVTITSPKTVEHPAMELRSLALLMEIDPPVTPHSVDVGDGATPTVVGIDVAGKEAVGVKVATLV
jgi:hypothetical protein